MLLVMFSLMSNSLPLMMPGPEGYDILPPGKHQCSFKEFYETFVTRHSGDTERRRKIMEDFLWVRQRQISIGLSVSSYWFDGSFVSGKPYPGDIDFVTHIDGATSNPLEDPSPWLNSRGTFQHTIAPGAERKLLVDIYSLVKLPDTVPGDRIKEYEKMWNYWNDWWQRARPTGEQQVKGYVEVINDGEFKI